MCPISQDRPFLETHRSPAVAQSYFPGLVLPSLILSRPGGLLGGGRAGTPEEHSHEGIRARLRTPNSRTRGRGPCRQGGGN